jgi:hypothetical protein
MNDTFVCVCCKKRKITNPKLKNQQLYCSDASCQRARKAKWKRDKTKSDPLFKAIHDAECRTWRKMNPSYWSAYRRHHPGYTHRNRDLQIVRDRKKKQKVTRPPLAKVDTLKSSYVSQLQNESTYWLVPYLAKVDALKVKLLVVTDTSGDLAKVDAIDVASCTM